MSLVADMNGDSKAAYLAHYQAIIDRMDLLVASGRGSRVSDTDLLLAHTVAGSTTVDKGVLGTRATSLYTRDPSLNMSSVVSDMQTSLNAYLSTVLGLSAISW